ncbi:MAG: radical SAM protein, partial [Deltaproteobacteria bacterium]
KKFRVRKPENVFSEIEILYHEYGIREFHIIDDTFNLIPKRAMKICNLVMKNGMRIDIAFPNGLRGDLIDDELLIKLKEAGTYKINFGIESATDRIQKIINKRLDINKVNTAISKAVKAGIFTHGWFMLGFPTETKDEMIKTIDFACNSKLHTAGFNIVIPFPATQLYEMKETQQCLKEIDFDNFNYRTATMNLSAVSLSDLRRLHKLAHRKFYFNPSRLTRIFLSTPNKLDIIRNLREHLRAQFF